MATSTVVLHVGGLHWATSAAAVEATLLRRPGVASVAANAANQTATVTYDAAETSVAQLSDWVRDCGLHCAGQSVPNHVCDPMAEPAEHEAHGAATPQEMMGHGGHAGMSMDQMVRDMRNRFLVALVLSIPIMLWSPMGRDMFGFTVPAPFGLRDDVFTLLLSLPVVFYSAWIFFDGAWRALRARTLDMMVLVAVAVGAGWLYSVGVTLTGGGEVFYEAASVLTTFVLLGTGSRCVPAAARTTRFAHCSSLRRRWPWCCAMVNPWRFRPPRLSVGDLLLIRPGAKIPVDGTVEDGALRGRRVDGHRRKPAGVKGSGLDGHRRLDQHHRHVAGPRHEGGFRHRACSDRRDGAGGAEL